MTSVVCAGARAHAQNPCTDIGSRENPEYPEAASHCTSVRHTPPSAPTSTTISATVPGAQQPTTDTDPECGGPLKLTVTCRRICGDLPAGKQPDRVTSTIISPPEYARFADFEAFPKGDHVRVCHRVKNWANEGFLKGTSKVFSFTVSYKQAPVAPPAAPKKKKPAPPKPKG
jgi:hypothetical protein